MQYTVGLFHLATSKGIIDLLQSADEKTQDITHDMDEPATPSEGERPAQNLDQDQLAPRVHRPPLRFISEGKMRYQQHIEDRERKERKRQQEAAGDLDSEDSSKEHEADDDEAAGDPDSQSSEDSSEETEADDDEFNLPGG